MIRLAIVGALFLPLALAGSATSAFAQLSDEDQAQLYLDEAAVHFDQDEFAEALGYIDRAEEMLGSANGRSLALSVMTLYSVGRILEAEHALNTFVAEHSDDVTPELRRQALSYLVRIEAQAEAERHERRKVTAPGPPFRDPRDNEVYGTVRIGDQTWMTENMRYRATESQQEANLETYGVLYRHDRFLEACPAGWQVPTVEEWRTLLDQVAADFEGEKDESNYWKGVGSRLISPEYPRAEEGAFDNYRFAVMPTGSGYRESSAAPISWSAADLEAEFWTSSVRQDGDFSVQIQIRFVPYFDVVMESGFLRIGAESLWRPVRCIRT